MPRSTGPGAVADGRSTVRASCGPISSGITTGSPVVSGTVSGTVVAVGSVVTVGSFGATTSVVDSSTVGGSVVTTIDPSSSRCQQGDPPDDQCDGSSGDEERRPESPTAGPRRPSRPTASPEPRWAVRSRAGSPAPSGCPRSRRPRHGSSSGVTGEAFEVELVHRSSSWSVSAAGSLSRAWESVALTVPGVISRISATSRSKGPRRSAG